mmetsp:Transcript_11071/g.18016  ORF Transcript_11071/g.18016 Transcript_11071/m.18016 type:complete len:252 (+) Transcript_11071:295-1050(+)|eukprot:jgi/Bigna1/135797/aug1.31_g10505
MYVPTDEELAAAVKSFLKNADLETVTSKRIRKGLEAKFKCKLKARKGFIEKAALAEMERMENETSKREEEKKVDRDEDSDEEEDSDDQPIAPRKRPVKSQKAPAKKPAKAEVTTIMENGVFYSRTGRPQRKSQAKKQIAAQMRRSRKRTTSAESGGSSDGKKKRKNGFSKPMAVTSQSLRNFLGKDTMPRGEAAKKIWDYLKKNCEQNEKDRRERLLDETLNNIFKVKKVSYFSLQKHLSKHMKDPDLIGM